MPSQSSIQRELLRHPDHRAGGLILPDAQCLSGTHSHDNFEEQFHVSYTGQKMPEISWHLQNFARRS